MLGLFFLQSSNASHIAVYVGEDGKIHFTDSTGADSVLPFNKGEDIKHTVSVSCPFDYKNDQNGLTVTIDGGVVYSTYGPWCARSWSGTV